MDESQPQALEALLERFFENLQDRILTGCPGVIEDYDPEAKTATIRIPFRQAYANDDGTRREEGWPLLLDVPIRFPRGGKWVNTWPLNEGDPVWLDFSHVPIDEWFISDGKTDLIPQIQGRHLVGDVTCDPSGGFPEGSNPGTASDKNWILEHEDGKTKIICHPDGTVQIVAVKIQLGSTDAAKALALAEETKTRLEAIESKFNSHTHVCVAPSSPSLIPNSLITPGPAIDSKTVFTNQ